MYENKLENLRDERDLKSKEVAEIFKVNKSTYSEWENDKIPIPTKRIIQISDYYNVNIDYMLNLTTVRKEIKPIKIDLKLIGKRLLEIRLENKLSLRDLNRILNISFSALAYYERGERLIKSDALIGISKINNYSIDWILGRSNDKFIKKNTSNK